jgi:hypothetical protein
MSLVAGSRVIWMFVAGPVAEKIWIRMDGLDCDWRPVWHA